MPQDVFSFATGYIYIAVILYYTGHTLFHRTYFMLQNILQTAVFKIKYVLYIRFAAVL